MLCLNSSKLHILIKLSSDVGYNVRVQKVNQPR